MGMKLKRKSIDLPNGVVKKLEALAQSDRRVVKNYMEKVLIEHANKADNDLQTQLDNRDKAESL